MCGIAGIFSQSTLNPSLLDFEDTLKVLAHRGPDGNGTFLSPSGLAAFVHTRLAIIDPSDKGAQPMATPDSKSVISYNGEIYNFEALKKHELLKDISFEGNSDTEVLLQLYHQSHSPESFLEKHLNLLNGIFAFAIWDETNQVGMIIRDRFGVKPIYFQEINNSVFFASEIKAIHKLNRQSAAQERGVEGSKGQNSKQLNPKALDGHLNYLWNPHNFSMFPGVKKLGPGEWLLFKVNEPIKVGKWAQNTDDVKKCNETVRQISSQRKDTISEVINRVKGAVHSQMISDVPIGAFLSGGLDSSAIVTFAREKNPDIQCFTIRGNGFQAEGIEDDYPYAKSVASHLNVKLVTVDVSPTDFIDHLFRMVEILEEPTADPAALNVLYISEVARKHGIKVLLSGTGGDDVFSGYRRHIAVHYREKLSFIPSVFREKLEHGASQLSSNSSYKRKIKKLFNGFSMGNDQYLLNCFRWSSDIDISLLYSENFKKALRGFQSDVSISSFLSASQTGMTQLRKALALEKRFFLAEHNLIYTDKMSMAAGVEVRVPFLDNDLVEYIKNIPDDMLINGRHAKWVLKKAMETYLPRNVIYRPKTGFGLPVRNWVKDELRDFINDTLNDQSLKNRGLFNPKAVKSLIKANMDGLVDASYTILSIICIELWCQRFLDR